MRRQAFRGGTALAALGIASAVLVAAPVDDGDDRPFIRSGEIGEGVETRYADFRVERVLAAAAIEGSDVTVATGTFLVVDVEVTAHRRSFVVEGAQLRDRHGRVFTYDEYAGCAATVVAPVEVPWHVRYCFDLPADALEGATILLARGTWTTDDSDVRWDEVAEVDLGIDRADARELAASDVVRERYGEGAWPLTDDDLEPADPDDVDAPVGILEEAP